MWSLGGLQGIDDRWEGLSWEWFIPLPEGNFTDGLPKCFDRGRKHKLLNVAFLKESETLGFSLEDQRTSSTCFL